MKTRSVLFYVAFCLSGVLLMGCKSLCPSGSCAVSKGLSGEGKTEEVGTLSVNALATLLKSGTEVVVFDARSAKYDDGRRIPGAKSLTDKASAQEVTNAIPKKDQLVVTYCANPQCPASDRLAKHLLSLGYSNILELPAGIEGWAAAGKPVEKAK